jgi:F-type H+-transporting ATPase subunit b
MKNLQRKLLESVSPATTVETQSAASLRSGRRLVPSPKLLRFALSLICLLGANALAVQQPASTPTAGTSKASPAPAQGSGLNAEFSSQTASAGQELSHVSNEAAGEDETTAFKYSPAVQGIAKITGLSPLTAYWICVVINFAIIAVGVIFLLKSNLPAMFRSRTQGIQKEMEEARRAGQEAQRRLKEIEERLSRMNIEIGEMQVKAEADSKKEEERILASIEEEKKRILQSAELEVEQATTAARRDLQKYAVSLAVELAEKGIRVNADEDKALVEDFASQLASEARRNGTG